MSYPTTGELVGTWHRPSKSHPTGTRWVTNPTLPTATTIRRSIVVFLNFRNNKCFYTIRVCVLFQSQRKVRIIILMRFKFLLRSQLEQSHRMLFGLIVPGLE